MPSTSWPATSAPPAPRPWPTTDGAPPLFATPRNPERFTDGPAVAAIARSVGTPLIPWQRYVADVANERRPDGSYEYQVVIVSVPRQTGKTTLIRATGVHRCSICGRDVFYTAQTGKDARARWMDLVKVLRNDEVAPAWSNLIKSKRLTIALRGGSEHVAFANGSVFQVFAPTPESLHGYTPPTVMLDEAFAYTAGEGELLMGAIGPAQLTITDRQLWIVSTRGTAESTFLHDWISRGMEGTPRVACFVWGARDDQDPYSADDVAAFHPGVGFVLNGKTITVDDVLEQVDRNTRAEYERAYANRATVTTASLIPVDVWRDLGEELAPPTPSDVVLTYDVAIDQAGAAILATWHDEATGKIATKIVQAGPGTDWLAAAVDDLDRTWRPRLVGAFDSGPARVTTAELRDRGVDVRDIGEREAAAASAAFLGLVDNRGVAHDGTPILELSVAGLVTRSSGADGVMFSRRHSVGDSSPAMAAVAGTWLVAREDSSVPVLSF